MCITVICYHRNICLIIVKKNDRNGNQLKQSTTANVIVANLINCYCKQWANINLNLIQDVSRCLTYVIDDKEAPDLTKIRIVNGMNSFGT